MPLILAAVCAWGVAYLLVTLSVVMLRIRRPDLPRAYRSPWFPLPQIISSVRDHHRYRQYHAARDGQPPGAGAVRHNARPDRRLRALFWTVCVQRVNPFKPLVVEEVVERAINNYEKQTRGEMTPDVLRPWFETPLMNAVQRDLAGWPSEKLSERSALLRLNDATAVTLSVRQKRLFMASIHSCEFVVEGPVTRPVRGNIRAHQSGWWKRQPIRFIGGKDSAELAGYLNGFPNLQQTLSELDYRRFR